MKINNLKNRDLSHIFSYALKFHHFLKLVCKRWHNIFQTNDFLKYESLTKQQFDWVDDCDSKTKIKMFKWLFIKFCPNYLSLNKQFCLNWFINEESDTQLISLALKDDSDDLKDQRLYSPLFTTCLGEEKYFELAVWAYQEMKRKPSINVYLRDVIGSANLIAMRDPRLPQVDPDEFSNEEWSRIFSILISFRSLDRFKQWINLFHDLRSDRERFAELLCSFVVERFVANWNLNTDKMIYFFKKYPNIKFSSNDFMNTLFNSIGGKMCFLTRDSSPNRIDQINSYLKIVLNHTNFDSLRSIHQKNLFWNQFLTKTYLHTGPDWLKIFQKLIRIIGTPTLLLETLVGCNDANVFLWVINNGFLVPNYQKKDSMNSTIITSYQVYVLFQQKFGILLKPSQLMYIFDHRVTFDLINNHSHTFDDLSGSYYDLELSSVFGKDLTYPDGTRVCFETFWSTFCQTQKSLTIQKKNEFLWFHFTRWLNFHFCDDLLTLQRAFHFVSKYVEYDDEKNLIVLKFLLKKQGQRRYLQIKQLNESGLLKIDSQVVKKLSKSASDIKFFQMMGFDVQS